MYAECSRYCSLRSQQRAAFFFTKILKAIVITEWMCYTKINYTATVVTHSL